MSRTTTRDRVAQIGDYRIERELRSEETGLVFLGTHMLLPRIAEVKVVHASHSWLRAAAVSVLREACLLEALSHPGIPRVYETGILPDKRPWSAFGRSDGTALTEHSIVAVSDLVPLIRDVADILAHAHTRGITHGKVTPDRILRIDRTALPSGNAASRGQASLSGAAFFPVLLRGWADATATDSPDAVSPLVDIYGLGAIAFSALAGKAPDGRRTAEHCPNAPAELTALIDRMLGKDVAAAEVRDCAGWLAATVELLPTKPRWTPVHGLGSDKLPVIDESILSIRFGK